MAKIDKTYHNLLKTILREGYEYEDPKRKGVIRKEINSYTFKHEFKHGFPALTTKKIFWKSVVGELIWFLNGDTNIKYLIDNNIGIWNKDAFNYGEASEFMFPSTMAYFLTKVRQEDKGIIPGYTYGDCDRIYGAQWRDCRGVRITSNGIEPTNLDQIENLIKEMKSNPMSTELIVNAWNPTELDSMALPPCHYSFIVTCRPLTYAERRHICLEKHHPKGGKDNHFPMSIDIIEDYGDIPTHGFYLKWNQRSVDTFLGLPFNIASYSLLSMLLGKATNIYPLGIEGILTNVHIYKDHMDAVKEQLSRDIHKYDACSLENFELTDPYLYNLNIEDFKLKGYKSYDPIYAQMIPRSN